MSIDSSGDNWPILIRVLICFSTTSPANGNACQRRKTGTPSQTGIRIASLYPTSNTNAVEIPSVNKEAQCEGTKQSEETYKNKYFLVEKYSYYKLWYYITSKVMNKTFARISLNWVGDSNDSTIITFLSLGATRACLKLNIFNLPKGYLLVTFLEYFTCKIINEQNLLELMWVFEHHCIYKYL